ncbi:glycosyltransferase [Lactobacillus sp. S2-2]|uniref:glycosyltransferase n=1 Tax=Lactobacillus sp. S2-2 TaxID=2692917 RepID=UPI001F2CF672|nr:glycosyltransferase [Lactobacillus sp. S2-2]MCF6515236.1 glycosyltransferase [Lactobacillus sp. S2-2]
MNDIKITAILPAHNEEKGIPAAIKSIQKHVDTIIVACDNCSDDIYKVSKKNGADIVFNTKNNSFRKAGAINQALENYINFDIPNSYCLIMDADTVVENPDLWFSKAKSLLYPNLPKISDDLKNMNVFKKFMLKIFNRKKYNQLFSKKAYDCIGSIFKAPQSNKISSNLEMGQRLEWIAYKTKIKRSQSVFILTGTCSLISNEVLYRVFKKNNYKYFYNVNSITEDFEMTISCKEVGARMISPMECECYTEIQTSIKSLLLQRRRWYLGALSLVFSRRMNLILMSYLGQQFMLMLSVFAYLLYIVVTMIVYDIGDVDFSPYWLIVFFIFQFKQIFDVWHYGNWFKKSYSSSMLGGLVYSFLLQVAYLMALFSLIFHKKIYWNK